jgi:hypothetical protein
MLREVTIVDPLKCTFAEELDSITMETLLVRHLSTKAAQDVMRAAIRSTFGMHISSFMPHLFFMGEKLGLIPERKNAH